MKIIKPIPSKLYLACSGGIDSMFAYHFFNAGRKDVCCLFFHHGTKTSDDAEIFLKKNVQNLIVGRLTRTIEKGESPEKFFRDQRYSFFSKFKDKPILKFTCVCGNIFDCFTVYKNTKEKIIPNKPATLSEIYEKFNKMILEDDD